MIYIPATFREQKTFLMLCAIKNDASKRLFFESFWRALGIFIQISNVITSRIFTRTQENMGCSFSKNIQNCLNFSLYFSDFIVHSMSSGLEGNFRYIGLCLVILFL